MSALAEKLAIATALATTESSFPHIFDKSKAVDVPVFPVEILPEKLRTFAIAGAKALSVPVDMIALPLLGFAGGTIGNTVAFAIKRNWIERANPWLGLIAPPGSGKSPAQHYAQIPVAELQRLAVQTYREKMDKWIADVESIKSEKGNREPLPEKPTLDHYFTTDATIEGLVNVLSGNPGITVTHDELSGFVAAMNAYRKGADRQSYLSLWAGATLKVDRRGAGTTYVPFPCVAVIGGIQPDMIGDLGESAGRRDGFIERFLLAEPKVSPQRWTEDEVDQTTVDAAVAVFKTLRVKPTDPSALPEPRILFPTLEARRAFGIWVNQNNRIAADSSGLAAGFYAKYPGQLLRVALILHCLAHPGDVTREVGVDSIDAAIKVIEYFRQHLVGILPRFGSVGSTKTAGLEPRVIRVLDKRRGEWVAKTDIHRGLGNSVTAAELATALEALVADEVVESRVEATGARPREEYRTVRRNEDMNHSRPTAICTEPDDVMRGEAA